VQPRGIGHALMIVDQFTRGGERISLPNQSVVAGYVPKHVCGVHRCELPVKRPLADGHWGKTFRLLETDAVCLSPPFYSRYDRCGHVALCWD
jgi:hypothetical protein